MPRRVLAWLFVLFGILVVQSVWQFKDHCGTRVRPDPLLESLPGLTPDWNSSWTNTQQFPIPVPTLGTPPLPTDPQSTGN
jgi:hypothetical protein